MKGNLRVETRFGDDGHPRRVLGAHREEVGFAGQHGQTADQFASVNDKQLLGHVLIGRFLRNSQRTRNDVNQRRVFLRVFLLDVRSRT